jgi:DNA-binding NarL/FixJ family response regulator
MINVLLADDHAVVRDGLSFILQAEGDIDVVASVANGRQAVSRAQALQPDVVLMDITMPELNGIEATALIRESCPEVRVIILSMLGTSEHVFRALQAGASGYLLKESAGQEVVEAVRAVAAGQRYLSPAITDIVVGDYLLRADGNEVSPLESLSPREREILQLVVEGKSSAEIAGLVHLSPKTVDTYRSRAMAKLGVTDLPALVKFAIQHGLIGLD